MTILRFVPFALLTAVALADEVPESLQRCGALEDDAQRLACYDRQVNGVRTPEPASESARAPAHASEAAEPARAKAVTPAIEHDGPASTREAVEIASPEPSAAARFGLPDDDDPEGEPDEIRATLVRIQVRSNGERIFELENGQVWVENSPKPSLRLEVGDTVTIKSGLFGSYRLFGSGHKSSGVDRIR